METQDALDRLGEWIDDDTLMVIDGIKYNGTNYLTCDAEKVELVVIYESRAGSYYIKRLYCTYLDEMHSIKILNPNHNPTHHNIYQCEDATLSLYIVDIPDVDSKLVDGDAKTTEKVKQMIQSSISLNRIYHFIIGGIAES